MKKIYVFIVAILMASIVSASGDLHLFEVENKNGAITPQKIEEAFVKDGFGIAVNSDMIKPFMIQFKETKFKIFTLMTIYHEQTSFDLVKKYPVAGVFTPLGVGIYQDKAENTLHVSILTSASLSKIMGIEDELIKKLESQVLATLKKVLPTAKYKLSQEPLSESRELLTRYELEVDGDDVKTAKENVLLGLDNGLSLYGFIVAGKLDLNKHMKDSPYDFYDGYSICKLPVIYTVALTKPEAAAFAPCTLAIYKKKDENKIVLEYPSVYNWISSALIKDKDGVDVLLKAQEQFQAILLEIVE
ncbi:hypothetical protein Suden_0268 [Sulfurimonas denitrificans DSM 1251]|jgi:uncharacterized protein (DUF302 family)|uniref:DUF302 domain-containing protein n=1 Tax=Sulfurimonas denitrificans (strain ATCC 33889 / DSM 1251) TaxID=326298 RepID=Q30TY2_SULDN|nr:hypothetical protein [Sulfurimonas denitrificans]ABB43549.1 hypothetical protein Suden_0268 [Sulfurimonas denitrificans DSM 1251]MDD3443478.1 DUF302 domain-containing protein [Sulfurimonas denitrificans]